MKFNKYKLFSFGLLLGVLFGGFLLFSYAYAQVDTGLQPVGEALGQEAMDIRVIIANIIKIALGLLGIVALVLILYGGFVWMTAGGNEDKVAQAKKILVNAAIGLVIILSAYAIVSFVINKLIEATSPTYPTHCFNGTQDEGETGVDCGGDCAACGGGVVIPAGNVFYVQQKPSGDACVRNFYPIVVFNRPVNLSSVAGNLIIRKVSDQSVAGGAWQLLSDTSQNAIKFVPNGDCGDGTNDCFDPATQYELVFVSSGSILSQDGLALICSVGAGCNTTEFVTGEGIDRNPPTIIIQYPENGERLEKGVDVPVDIVFTDDNGVQNISLYNDGGFVTSQSISGCVQTGSVQLNWPTNSVSVGNHTLRAVGWDYSAAEDDATVNVVIQPSHCFNNEMDEDETGVDCGGECGTCEGGSCTADEQCSSGYCEIPEGGTEGVCVDKMQITGVSPLSGALDTYVTISGKFFGPDKGTVYMTASAGGWIEAPIVSCGVGFVNWTDAQIVVSVPRGATDGPFRVDTKPILGKDGKTREFSDTTNDNWGPNFAFDVNDVIRPGLCMLNPTSGPPYSTTAEIIGKNFGASVNNATTDVVKFGELKSIITTWTDELVRVKVPGLDKGAVSVNVENDGVKGNGLRFYVSEETNVDTPIIYSITPNHGARGEYVTLTGDNFGNYLGKVILKPRTGSGLSIEGNFDFPDECGDDVWSDTQIIFKIPESVVLNQEYSVQVQTPTDPPKMSPIGGYFLTEPGVPSPGLCRIDPISGPVPFAEGKTMGLYGEYFTDTNVTAPYFWSATASDPATIVNRVKTTEFLSWWDRELIVRPPLGAISGPVVVSRSTDNKMSNPLAFSVFDCTKNNNTCAADGFKCCTLGVDAGVCINENSLCAGETQSTGYMWRFSTRDFPLVPRVLESCNADTDLGKNLPSPSPNVRWNAGTNDHSNVCRTALVTIGFTAPVAQNTVNASSVHVYKCKADGSGTGDVADNQCKVIDSTVAMNPNDYTLKYPSDSVNNYYYLAMRPNAGFWDDNSWYQVVLDDSIESVTVPDEGNYTLAPDRPCGNGTAYCFVFRTDANECKMKRVVITPFDYWTSILEEPIKYRILRNNANDAGTDLYYTANGLSNQHCIMMDTTDYEWSWESEEPDYAPIFSVDAENPNRAQVSALANTVGVGLADDSVDIKATASRNGLDFEAISPLTIDLSAPEVVDYWPNCLEACPNAQVGVRFNLAMSDRNVTRGVNLYKCNNENCTSRTAVTATKQINAADRREIIITPSADLAEGGLYLVTITSSSQANRTLWTMGSASDPTILGKGYYGSFSWRFRVKNEACKLDRVEVTPAVFNAPFMTSRHVYGATAFASPDECRTTGQRLNAWDMSWSWQSSDTQVATVKTFTTKSVSSGYCTSNCLLAGSEILYGEEFNEPVCGNGKVEAGEDCDHPDKNSNCGLNCLLINKTNTGSLSTPDPNDVNASICGNGLIGTGEDCDLGVTPDVRVTTSSMNCAENCLHTGSRLSAAWCSSHAVSFGSFEKDLFNTACANVVSRCGDQVPAPNEDALCDSVAFNPDICEPNCTLKRECLPYNDDGRVEGCGLDDKLSGSSLAYSVPSVCGDGMTGIGEHTNCEAKMTSKNHTYVDPWVLVIGKGKGTLSGDPPTQSAKITGVGTQPSTSVSETGSGMFVIQCGYKSDSECTQNVSYCGEQGCGVADNTCCYPRPAVLEFYPAEFVIEYNPHGYIYKHTTANVCPNTYIDVTFDKKIDPLTLEGNVFLARGDDADNCTKGEDVSYLLSLNQLDPNAPWYKKVWHAVVQVASRIKNALIGLVTAQTYKEDITAQSWCTGLDGVTAKVIYEPIGGGVEEIDTVSHVRISLTQPLATSTDYTVMLRPGVRDIRGVSIGKQIDWQFITAPDICTLESLSIEPSEYMFDSLDEVASFQAMPKTFEDKVIQPVAGYDWGYLWGPENNDYVFLNTTTASVVEATTKNRNGEMDLINNVVWKENIFNIDSPELSASSHLTTFICENKWPVDQTVFTDANYDFSFYYCMDAGGLGVSDDLPDLEYTVKNSTTSNLETGVLRKYLFFTKDVPDAVGVSVIANASKSSVYELLPLAGFENYQKMKVKGFDAITDGYNIYVDAVVKPGSTVYSNIYLFSLNQNAGSEMKSIFDQIMENLEFNLSADNIKYCGIQSGNNFISPNFERPCETDMECVVYSDTPVCLNIKDKIARNYTRFKDMRSIKKSIEDYKVETGNTDYPAMANNTYLAGQAMSVWSGAWNELGSQVGVLPTDPINALRKSGTCYNPTSKACVSDETCGAISSFANNLTAEWLADNSTQDEIGTRDGVISGSVNYTPGKGSGSAFEFNGDAESYITIPNQDPTNYGTRATLSFWFKPTKQAPAILFKKGGAGDNNDSSKGYQIEYSGKSFYDGADAYNNGTIRFAVYEESDTPKYYAVDTREPLTLNKWHHIAVRFDNGDMRVIVDGVSFTQKRDQNRAVAGATGSLRIFTDADMIIGKGLNGALDNIYYYYFPLTTANITALNNHLCVFHDAVTGWSTEDFRFSFACNTESLAYRYIFDGEDNYTLRAKMEKDGLLYGNNFIKGDSKITYDSYGACASSDEISSPNSLICGDGIIGTTEGCDPPGTIVWDTSGCPDSSAIQKKCSDSCQLTSMGSKECRKATGGTCGDGKIQYLAGEVCDDGELNGQIWRCKDDCSGIENTKCGNGQLDKAAGELCDPTVGRKVGNTVLPGWCVGGPYTFDPANAVETFVPCDSNSDCVTDNCYLTNVRYSLDPNDSCNWDCKSRGPYCGDTNVDDVWGEGCDGSVACTLPDGREGRYNCLSNCRKDNTDKRDMLALWEFDYIGENGEVPDTMGNYNGSCKTGECPDIVEGKHEGNPAFDFMGQTRLVTVDDQNDKTMATPPFSWEMWFKPVINTAQNPRMLEKGGRDHGFGTSGATGRIGGPQVLIYASNANNSNVQYYTRYFRNNQTADADYLTSNITLNVWHHLIAAFEPTGIYSPTGLPADHHCWYGTLLLYVDGVLKSSETNGRFCDTDYPLCFGVKCDANGNVDYDNSGNAYSFKGAIEDIAFYNKVIDQETIGDHANNQGWYCTAYPDDYYEDDPNQPDYVAACGNGVLDEGEICDTGDQNGVPCTPNKGSRCSYCAYACDRIATMEKY